MNVIMYNNVIMKIKLSILSGSHLHHIIGNGFVTRRVNNKHNKLYERDISLKRIGFSCWDVPSYLDRDYKSKSLPVSIPDLRTHCVRKATAFYVNLQGLTTATDCIVLIKKLLIKTSYQLVINILFILYLSRHTVLMNHHVKTMAREGSQKGLSFRNTL